MFRTVADFEQNWKDETEATLKLFRAMTDASLGQQVCPGGRNLGRIAWHIVQTLPEMGGHAGLKITGPAEDAPVPASASAIADAFQAAAAQVGPAVAATWKDADLTGEIQMYGETWTRGKAMVALIAHQTHHRGQMTVLMRQAGVKVPGVYGPAKEDWAAFGMPTPE